MSAAPATAPSRRKAAPAGGRGLSSVRPPRRVSGPSPGRRTTPAAPQRRLPRPLLAVARGLARVSRHPLTDRVISGRWSIALIAFALIGIVTLQLGLLKLNVGVGRSLERAQTLERENATLGIENAELASPERIRQLAVRLGMSPVALTQLRFLRADSRARCGSGRRRTAARARTPGGRNRSATSTGSEASSSEASSSEASSSEASSGETSSTKRRSAEASSGETASSEAASSEAASGETSSGEASSSKRPPAPKGRARKRARAASEAWTSSSIAPGRSSRCSSCCWRSPAAARCTWTSSAAPPCAKPATRST